MKTNFQFQLHHFSSTHPLVQQIVSKIKLGFSKPLWYETVVNTYPPLPPFPGEKKPILSKASVSTTSTQRKAPRYKSINEPTTNEVFLNEVNSITPLLHKDKHLLTKAEREMLNWKHLFPTHWDESPLPEITPEKIQKNIPTNSYDYVRCALDPLCTTTIGSQDEDHLLEEKLARESAIILNPNASSIEPNSIMFSQLESNKQLSDQDSLNLKGRKRSRPRAYKE